MKLTRKYLDDVTYEIIGCAIEVHRHLGPGLIESIYEKCFLQELLLRNIRMEKQLWTPVVYKGITLDTSLRLDVLVENCVIVELKSVETMIPVYEAQILTYMKLLEKPKGVLINFNCTNIFKEGQKTFVNEIYASFPKE
jgi:GxxExxY protein